MIIANILRQTRVEPLMDVGPTDALNAVIRGLRGFRDALRHTQYNVRAIILQTLALINIIPRESSVTLIEAIEAELKDVHFFDDGAAMIPTRHMNANTSHLRLLEKCKAELLSTQWVPTSERLPDSDRLVFGYNEVDGVILDMRYQDEEWITEYFRWSGSSILFWMDKPTSPNNEQR